jgi:diadenylate cyclase
MFGDPLTLFGVIDFRLADVLDILFVATVLYYLFLLFQGTRAAHMLFGFVLLLSVYLLSQWWELKGVSWLFSNLATVGVVALVILFQPELRGALTRLGQTASKAHIRRFFFEEESLDEMLWEVREAVDELSRKRYGALIVLEQQVGLKTYVDTGEPINSRVSARLLQTIFFPNTPLHDGAVILHKDRILAAACVLPVQTVPEAGDENMGMRHRAARALTRESDALVVIVSEETGHISLAWRNNMNQNLAPEMLEEQLRGLLYEKL